MESSYIFKEFFERTIDTKNYESRDTNIFFDNSERENYLFNSKINGIEDADLIFLIGTNPRFEATMLNARIRKAFLNNKTKIVSLNDVGDLTYPYQSMDGNTQTIKDIIENNNEFTKDIIRSSKTNDYIWRVIFKIKISRIIYSILVKNFLLRNNKFTEGMESLKCFIFRRINSWKFRS